MAAESNLTHCDFCGKATICQNIFIAIRIFESEMAYCRDPSLVKRFEAISNEVADLGYHYPRGIDQCGMAVGGMKAEAILLKLRQLLDEVRAQIKLYGV